MRFAAGTALLATVALRIGSSRHVAVTTPCDPDSTTPAPVRARITIITTVAAKITVLVIHGFMSAAPL
jgi:hypothetical protein